jgi:mRNA-degrading endonuclease YafQ of YafQ-DinJ toxin-antitoxin module
VGVGGEWFQPGLVRNPGPCFTKIEKLLHHKPIFFVLQSKVQAALRLLASDPFERSLQAHKPTGQWAGSWACIVGHDCRIIFDFVELLQVDKDAILVIDN